MLSGVSMAAFAMIAALQQVGQAPVRQNRDTTRLDTLSVRAERRSATRYASTWSATTLKINAPLRDTPHSVTVLTSAFMREGAMQSMADAVRYVPSVTMGQGEGHRDAPTIRGNSSTSDFFVDGIRDDAQYHRDLYNVERLEALLGPNAVTFGRGGGGGVINRVTKQARWERDQELILEGGAFEHRRVTMDRGGAMTERLAARTAAMYENSGGFRDAFMLRRYGVSPSAAMRLGRHTLVRLQGEYFDDARRVDRGMPSFQGRPSAAPIDMFFGNPDSSRSTLQMGSVGGTLEHRAGDRVSLRTHLRVTAYDKFYQNVLPGAMNDAGSHVSLSAYSNDTQRENYFAQSEATLRLPGLGAPQTLLAGVEIGRQYTDNVRQTGYFDGTAATLLVPFGEPTVRTPVTFRAAGADANNTTLADVASVYAQEQVWLWPTVQATIGVRADRFALTFLDHRDGSRLERTDVAVSPRAGLVYKMSEPVSLYASLSRSFLPASGDQFSGLTPTLRTLEPERFTNREAGVKWQVLPDLLVTAAGYELTRTNSAAPSAVDPGVIVQTGTQRTRGMELTTAGRASPGWDVVASVTLQSARILSRTTAAPAGAIVPLVPRRTFSVWNRFALTRSLGVGAGAVSQSQMFAAIDNAVMLPGFTRFDAGVYLKVTPHLDAQLNGENLLNTVYYATSHGNNNIMPGAPRTLRASLTVR